MRPPRFPPDTCFQILLENGADIEAVDEEGFVPLYVACINGSVQAARVGDIASAVLP